MLTLYMRTMYGEIDEAKNGTLTDVSTRELVTFAPLLAMVFIMGVYPAPFLNALEPTVKNYIRVVEDRRQLLKSSAPLRMRQIAEEQAADKKISSVSNKATTAPDSLAAKQSKV